MWAESNLYEAQSGGRVTFRAAKALPGECCQPGKFYLGNIVIVTSLPYATHPAEERVAESYKFYKEALGSPPKYGRRALP